MSNTPKVGKKATSFSAARWDVKSCDCGHGEPHFHVMGWDKAGRVARITIDVAQADHLVEKIATCGAESLHNWGI